jgi:hypothetical protein
MQRAMLKLTVPLTTLALLLYSCGGSDKAEGTTSGEAPQSMVPDVEKYDPNRGLGKHTDIQVGETLDLAMAEAGNNVQSVKCASCHKLTVEKLVGPGWKGVTQRRTPAWLMNFITNPDPMIDKDPELQAQLELCLVRMPNQSLTDEDARNIVEFMRQNDGVK